MVCYHRLVNNWLPVVDALHVGGFLFPNFLVKENILESIGQHWTLVCAKSCAYVFINDFWNLFQVLQSLYSIKLMNMHVQLTESSPLTTPSEQWYLKHALIYLSMFYFFSSVIFQCDIFGEFWYELQMSSEKPAPIKLPEAACELGKLVLSLHFHLNAVS